MKLFGFFLMLTLALSVTGGLNAQVKNERLSGTYEGAKKKELANGLGKAVGKDTYEGSFKKGLPEGIGIYTFGEDVALNGYSYKKGDRYEGNFKKGLFEGKGKVIFADRDKGVLEGYFSDGKYKGRTKDGYEWVKEDSEGIMRVIVKKNNDNRNDIFLSGIDDITEIGQAHSVFNSTDKEWTDIRSEEFPYTIYVKGVNPMNNARVRVKVMLETPGTWTIQVDPK